MYGLNFYGMIKVVDTSGFYTGETKVSYGKAIEFEAHISGARGSSQSEIFGTDISYDKTIVITKQEFDEYGFDENTVFFIDKPVEYASDETTPLYNYRVARIAETINEVVIAVRSVRNDAN